MQPDQKAILLVENDEVTLELYHRELIKEFQVYAFTDEQGVMEVLCTQDISAVVIEPEMRTRQGWHLLAAIQAVHHPHPVPILVCTVRDSRRQAMESGAAAYLVKPVLPRRLLEKLHEVMLQQGTLSEEEL
jgi:DNA-binding response OmpR family regulator